MTEDETWYSEEEGEDETALLPPYLREVDTSPAMPCGTLHYNRRSKVWVVRGTPEVTEMCKRLFPSSAGSKRGRRDSRPIAG